MSDLAKTWPVVVVDIGCDPPCVVIRYKDVPTAEWYIQYLYEHGGDEARRKIDHGDYSIDAPEGKK